jgi:hypothetical protein
VEELEGNREKKKEGNREEANKVRLREKRTTDGDRKLGEIQ